jgi:N-6 DNA methylase
MCDSMAKEHFFHPQTPTLFKKLEELSRRSSVSRGQAFEDWLTAIVCALAAETKEAEYLAMVERHQEGKIGQRGIDLISQMFAELLLAMEKNDGDILGDLFEGGITYGDNGQYLTPENLAQLMARLSLDENAQPSDDAPLYVNDPCYGTGRMLLEAAAVHPRVELVGQDIDPRCAKITAINLGLRSRYGWVICGNTITNELRFAYRVGSFYHESPNGLRRGVIREVPISDMPVTAIAEEMRGAVGEVIEEPGDGEASVMHLPPIIEVPRWLARLEPMMTRCALSDEDRNVEDAPPPPEQEEGQVPTQRTLFD